MICCTPPYKKYIHKIKKLFEQERTITYLVVATPFDFNIFFFFGHRVHPAEARPDTADWG